MNTIGKTINKTRKIKGFSQEKLAELSSVNLRTIQRIESNENVPRGKTLSLICNVLEIDIETLMKIKIPEKPMTEKIVNWFFLVILNFLLMTIFGFLLLDSNANWNSRLGGFLLSFFIPMTIVYFTRKMSGFERMFKFGFGFMIYIILSIFMIGIQNAIILLIPFLLIALAILYYGNRILNIND
ncbi:Helix-turn-helix [Lutibacter oricola]|uniref:Helix-turn-helix n=1 Tax=Lutibacter oricola TaxID=762486 RepID=A0A1H3GR62_9FLAO|nr:helix-turn-helix transcriptional regulator [Lutibacter oricola]SDY05540.1 Helix-turn-helix [Lutibacter oricola]